MSHRHKKQFQLSITSFLVRSDRQNTTHPPIISTPTLDEHIQLSLAQVGMRIRKAVPEGYKSQRTGSSYKPPPPTPTTTMTISTRPSELLPFCGLHKIGALREQPTPIMNAYESIHIFSDTTTPLPDSLMPYPYQESATSTGTVTPPPAVPLRHIPSNKRSHDSEEEEEEQEQVPDEPEFEKFVFNFPAMLSPTRSTYPISHTAMPDLAAISSSSASRVYSKPKSRRKRPGESQHPSLPGFSEDMDFEDANFLAPADDEEVEMGGI